MYGCALYPCMNEGIYPYLIFWSIGLSCFAAEWIFPARSVSYRNVFLRDLIAAGIYFIFFGLTVYCTDRIPVPTFEPQWLYDLPSVVKLLLFYLVEDFGLYWMHRLMHTQYVWRVHKWHHSPTYLYWLAGWRATIPHILLFNLSFIVALPFLYGASPWVFPFIIIEHQIRNNWMHLNVSWRSNWLEWIIVTPRYHRIHHSDNPAHHNGNYGALFTIWDRLFGTYVNPEEVSEEISFGIGERVHPARLIIGV